jgi:hypothetical protein
MPKFKECDYIGDPGIQDNQKTGECKKCKILVRSYSNAGTEEPRD